MAAATGNAINDQTIGRRGLLPGTANSRRSNPAGTGAVRSCRSPART
jgi:hypothetical protein